MDDQNYSYTMLENQDLQEEIRFLCMLHQKKDQDADEEYAPKLRNMYAYYQYRKGFSANIFAAFHHEGTLKGETSTLKDITMSSNSSELIQKGMLRVCKRALINLFYLQCLKFTHHKIPCSCHQVLDNYFLFPLSYKLKREFDFTFQDSQTFIMKKLAHCFLRSDSFYWNTIMVKNSISIFTPTKLLFSYFTNSTSQFFPVTGRSTKNFTNFLGIRLVFVLFISIQLQ